jgi:hypothetical protein
MQGIAATDARLPFVVVRGLDDEAFEVMDRGRSRAFRTVLEGRGFRNSGILASAARLMWQWERSKFKEVHGVTPSIPELSRIVADHPKLLESLSYSNSLRGLLTPAAACWVEYMLIAKGGQRAEEFLARLSTGEDLRRGNPILVLRKVLTDAHARGKRGRGVDDEQAGQLDLVTQAALTVLAWNKWNDGKTVRFVNWSKAEEFPEVAPAKLGPLGESEVSS